MGINVTLITERGEELEYIGDPKGILSQLLPPEDHSTYPFLNSIDLYGDTVFNRIQMRHFLTEWEFIESQAKSDEERAYSVAVKRMAARCYCEVHTYLKFLGD